jgi:hypothetical protein
MNDLQNDDRRVFVELYCRCGVEISIHPTHDCSDFHGKYIREVPSIDVVALAMDRALLQKPS